jgi:iron complex transport system ATP-binding protein
VALLRDGQLVQHGDKAEVLTDAALSKTFGMPVRVQRRGDYYSAAVE